MKKKFNRHIIPKFSLLSLPSKIRNYFISTFWHRGKRPYDISKGIIFVNKRSRGYFSPFRRLIFKCFVRKRGLPARYITSMDEIVNSKEAKKAKCIFIASGDGFFDGVMSHPFFNKKTLGFFPMGAGNAVFPFLYKMKTLLSLCTEFDYYQTEIDVFKLICDGHEVETTWLSIGFDAEFIRLNPPRSKNGLVDYSKAALKSVTGAKSRFEFEVRVDRKHFHWKHGVNITLGKFPFYGFRIRSLPYTIKAADGNVYGMVCKSLIKNPFTKVLRVVTMASTMIGMYHPSLKKLIGKKIVIESPEPLPIQVAGDFFGHSKRISVEVKRKQKLLIA